MVLSHRDMVEERQQAAEGQPGRLDRVCSVQERCKHYHCFSRDQGCPSLPSSVKGMQLFFKSQLLPEASINFFYPLDIQGRPICFLSVVFLSSIRSFALLSRMVISGCLYLPELISPLHSVLHTCSSSKSSLPPSSVPLRPFAWLLLPRH